MSISFVAQAHAPSLTGTEPTGTAQDDVLIAFLTSGTAAQTNPGGWTQVGVSRTAGSTFATCWYIQRGSSAPNLTWGGGGGSPSCDIVSYRGAKGTTHQSAQSAAGSAVAPSLTTTLNDCFLICTYADDVDQTITVPSGMTNRTTIGSNAFGRIAELVLTAAGATGTKTFTTTTTPVGAWSIALAPNPAPPSFQRLPMRIWRGRRR